MADQKINALPVKTAPTTGDKMLMIGTAEEYQIDYDQLATAILNKLTSKTYALDQGTKTLVAALNELNSNMNKIQNYTTLRYANTDANEYVKAGEIAYDAGVNLILVYAIYDHGKPYGLMLKSKSGPIIAKTEYSDFNNYGNPSILYYFHTNVPDSYEVWCKRTETIDRNSSIAYSVVKLSGN